MKSNWKSQVTAKLDVGRDVSAWLLLGTNIATIIWAQVAAWDLGTIMWVYWSQSMCIGVLWFFKILTLRKFSVKADGMIELYKVNDQVVALTKDQRIMLAVFFLLFYGFFHLWFGIFLVMQFGVKDLWSIILMSAVFVGYQAYSFFYNRKWEQGRNLNIGGMMFFPLLRIAPMFLIFMVGVLWIESQPGSFSVRAAMVLFMVLKTVADVSMHVVEQRKFA
ncbi:MAG: DUF6498-containing protein [Phycisphaerae bacterium]|nr:DUF6498-containing protein [Phycisphaerae bacterium]